VKEGSHRIVRSGFFGFAEGVQIWLMYVDVPLESLDQKNPKKTSTNPGI
jgi:hypothetical protein